MIHAILERRSIRKYKPYPIPRPLIEEILKAGILAPSSKNRQPWRFVVVSGASKDAALAAMAKGLEREKSNPLIPDSAPYIAGAEHTLKIMEQAPVIIFILNTLGVDIHRTLTTDERVSEICNAQSIGAAIENMSLAAADLGLGSLWICDTYFAYEELCRYLGCGDSLSLSGSPIPDRSCGELFAALAVGYADESPAPRPRKSPGDVIEWRI